MFATVTRDLQTKHAHSIMPYDTGSETAGRLTIWTNTKFYATYARVQLPRFTANKHVIFGVASAVVASVAGVALLYWNCLATFHSVHTSYNNYQARNVLQTSDVGAQLAITYQYGALQFAVMTKKIKNETLIRFTLKNTPR